MSVESIILIGGGGHCRACIDVVEKESRFSIAGIIEQPGKNFPNSVLGYPVIGDDTELAQFEKQYKYALITIGQVGSSHVRQKLFNQLKTFGFILPVIISPLAMVSPHADLEEGTIVMHRSIVNAGAKVGKNCILNSGSLIEHDTQIGDHAHISTAAVINGETIVGSGSFVGSNATVVHGIHLANDYFFKAGGLITGNRDGKPIKRGG